MGRPLGKHWSGGVTYVKANGRTRVELLPGWPACVYGYAARRIAADPGRHTCVAARVTCKACLRLMSYAGITTHDGATDAATGKIGDAKEST